MCCVLSPQAKGLRLKHSTNCSTRSGGRSTSWPGRFGPKEGDNAMVKTTWGRKETVIWPYYRPLYTYGAVFLAVVLTGLFLYCRFSFVHRPLQRFYAPLYMRTAMIDLLRAGHRDTYRM